MESYSESSFLHIYLVDIGVFSYRFVWFIFLEALEFQFYIVVFHLLGAFFCVQDNVHGSNFSLLDVNIQSFHTICLHFVCAYLFSGVPITCLTAFVKLFLHVNIQFS